MHLYRKHGITYLAIALWYGPAQVAMALAWLAAVALGWWLGRPAVHP